MGGGGGQVSAMPSPCARCAVMIHTWPHAREVARGLWLVLGAWLHPALHTCKPFALNSKQPIVFFALNHRSKPK